MIRDAQPLFTHREKMQLQYSVRNTHRAVGTRLAAMITRKYGMAGLQPDTVTVRLRGTAGQSLGAFAVRGMKLEVFGDANDYVGKGLSGGTIVVKPTVSSPLVPETNAIIGNTVLYGATAGKLFACGRAGERFAVRNSGADTVVEGVGSNGCEYMTGGTAVILGAIGVNFAAGMTGGMAFVYDPEDVFTLKVNPETVSWQRIDHPHWEARAQGAGRGACRRDQVAARRAPAERLEPRGRTLLAGGARRRCCRACRSRSRRRKPSAHKGHDRRGHRARAARRVAAARSDGRAVRPHLARHQDRSRGQHAGVAGRGARHAVGARRLRDAGRARAPAMAEPRRLADRAVGRRLPAHPASSPSPISACRACRRAARACSPTPPCCGWCPCRCWSAKGSAGAASPAPCSDSPASSC